MGKWPRRRIFLVILALVVLGVVVPPSITLKRFHARIQGAIAQAVGRPVTLGGITLRLFPEPGFNLRGLVIGDDPALSAEPMLRADEVTATLRLSSLWRGRLEIGKLSFKYPSMNLVRGPDGRWNIESLLEQVRKIPSAPTAQTRPESRPRFPYIEASDGRINFKVGQEKKVYALTEADFALWLASENEWRVRLAARPIRTDANLSDTGTIRLNGSFQRAYNLRATPLQLRLELQRAQLGQLTNLIYGRDRGWRGAVNASLTLSGTPGTLKISADAAIDDFRRYDILSGEALRLEAHCSANFSTTTELSSDINCRSPLGPGMLRAGGSAQLGWPPARYDVSLTAEEIPAQAVVVLLRHLKKDLPPDLSAGGAVDATCTLRADEGTRLWAGSGTTSELQLRSSTLGKPLTLGDMSFRLEGPGTQQFIPIKVPGRNTGNPPRTFSETVVSFQPFSVPLGGPAPAQADAWFSSSGYSLQLAGDGLAQRLVQVARGIGLHAPTAPTAGTAKVDLEIAGTWFGFAAPRATGTVQLHNLSVPLQGAAAPLQISSGELLLDDESAMLQKLNATFPGTRGTFTGWVRLPRGCETLEGCPAQFELQADTLATDDLNRLFNPQLRRRPWYDLLGSAKPAGLFSKLQASGRLTASRVLVKSVVAHRVSAQLGLEPGKASLREIRGELWGGSFRGAWSADFTGPVPVYSSSGRLDRASMSQVATAMDDDWATGTATLTYEGTASGWSGDEVADSAAGVLDFDWRDGTLAHLALAGASPLHLRRFSGRMNLRGRILELVSSKIETPGGIYKVIGTASLARQLGITLLGERSGMYSITGPLEKPQVAVATPSERASLKP